MKLKVALCYVHVHQLMLHCTSKFQSQSQFGNFTNCCISWHELNIHMNILKMPLCAMLNLAINDQPVAQTDFHLFKINTLNSNGAIYLVSNVSPGSNSKDKKTILLIGTQTVFLILIFLITNINKRHSVSHTSITISNCFEPEVTK